MGYPKFPSIERLENIYCIISEKIDGTNGLIEITQLENYKTFDVKFGSRNRYLTLDDDNAGFMNFFHHYTGNIELVHNKIFIENYEQDKLTDDTIRIYGEWFGKGIQRGYGLKEKFFMPFSNYYSELLECVEVPNIFHSVDLYRGKFSIDVLNECMNNLAKEGSQVISGYNKPEGVVISFPQYNFKLKETFEGAKWKHSLNQ